ncbi:MAG: M56 family metallopeptidase [Phycisphaerales bacterium]
MEVLDIALDLLWRNALGVVPLAIAVAALARVLPMRPTTRHALWVAALIGFLAPPLLPGLARFGPPSAAEIAERAANGPDRAGQRLTAVDDTPVAAEAALPAPELPTLLRSLRDRPAEPQTQALTTRRLGAPTGFAESGTHASERVRSVGSELPAPDRALPQIDAPGVTARQRSPLTTPISPALRTTPLTATPSEAAADDALARSDLTTETTPAGVVEPATKSPSPAHAWGVTLLSLREALIAMPHIPAHVWLLGAMTALAIGGGRVWWFRRLLARGHAPDTSVEAMVASASATLGLRRTPETTLVDERITPMVWCGRRARLVLPRPLWDELDEVGRAAVVHHELAHLKRRDHWVCWVEAVVGLLYWWHPIAWWVRKRIREEADLCCDAWVTALLPEHRTAYAQALVSTRRYISEHGSAPPAVGLGVMSNRGRRFARRLLMIMTHSHKPRLSTTGRALALVVAAAGAIASPVLACPPEEKEKKAEARAVEAPKPDKRAKPGKAESAPDDRSTFEQFMEGRGDAEPAPKPDAREPRAQRVEYEARLAALQKRLAETVEASKADGEICASEEKKIAAISGEVERVAAAMAAYSTAQAAATTPPRPARVAAVGSGQRQSAGESTYVQWAQGGDQIVKKYEINADDKRARLTALLVRDDVPLRVSPDDDGITVIGSREQHDRFAAFLSLIDGDDELERVYSLPEGRLDALTELMVLSNVPVLVRPEDDGLRVYGSELDHQVFAGFVDLLGDGEIRAIGYAPHDEHDAHRETVHAEEDDDDCSAGRARVLTAPRMTDDQRRAAERELARQREHAHAEARARTEHERARVRQMQELERHHARTMEQMARFEQRVRAYEVKAEALERKADEIERAADDVERQADEIERQADQLFDNADHVEDEATVEKLHAEAERLLEQAERVREKADDLRDKADRTRDEADDVRDRADEIRDEAEEAREAAEDIASEREEAMARAEEAASESR